MGSRRSTARIVRQVPRLLRQVPRLLRQAAADAWHDRVLGLSAEAAFWQLLSLPSLFLALIATLGYVSRWIGGDSAQRIESRIESTLGRAFSPQVVAEVVHPTLHEVLFDGRLDVISIGFILALWAGSSATATFVNTITIAYDMRDLRGPVRSRLLALGLFLGSVLVGVIVLPMLVLGPKLLTDSFPKGARSDASDVIAAAYYPTVVVLLMLGLTTLYHLAPPRRLPWHRGVPGSIVAILVFLAGSAALRTYISFILDHNHAYGNLASPIAALLFFFLLALGVLFGAEFNAAIERQWPTPLKPARVLGAKGWQRLTGELPVLGDSEVSAKAENTDEADSETRAGSVDRSPIGGAPPERDQPDSTLS